ncbi:hypothetical protein L5515_005360 [Caenorhabditis briggsae]|uniref:Uncharacterized protein n=1 Tax=Caenorhabditis briggsae TaxID=6238 RepID=A0AAE9EK42_CAEBR|nr:hypothetical protein L5515_005360 [Caenorhabditis briggsae]
MHNIKRSCFVRIANAVDEIDDDYDEMSYEGLVERYNFRRRCDDIWESYRGKKDVGSKEASAKKTMDWTLFQNMGNRVKKAVTGIFESMKKSIGKKNKEEK